MPKMTSVYLPDDLANAVLAAREAGVNMTELIRRGLAAQSPDERLARLAAQEAARETADAMLAEITSAVRSALRDLQGSY
jgi:Arc/MetJ-type ribon-helix-helix transcriptional regulator